MMMKKLLQKVFPLLGVGLFSHDLHAARAVLSQDACTSAAAASSRAVLSPTAGLCVDGRSFSRRRVWLQFDLASALPPAVDWSRVSKATLSVFINNVNVPGWVDVCAVKEPWNEGVLSDAKAPPLANDPGTGAPYARAKITGALKWVSFDVTELVRDWVDGSLANNGMSLVAGDNGVVVVWQSKEVQGAPQAVLEIVTDGEQGPPGPQGIAGRDGAVGPAGQQGITGAQGAPGPAGPPGPRGETGPQGPQGFSNESGIEGASGGAGGVWRLSPRGDIAMGEFTQGPKP